MNKIKNIVCFDVETTGLSPENDYIIQLAAVKFNPKSFKIVGKVNWVIKPSQPYVMTPAATNIHHMTKEFVEKNGVPLASIANEFVEFIKDCDFLSYNGNTFDIKFLVKDFGLIGVNIELEGRYFYDAYAIETRLNPRTLSAVYKKYTGQELNGAHDAFNDVLATIGVFRGQIESHNMTYDKLNEMEENTILTTDGSIRRANTPDQPELIVFTRGKYKEMDFLQVCEKDPSYIDWFMNNVATNATKKVLHKYYWAHRNKNSKSSK